MSQRTGTFDVVMEVSGTTINRILATVHQNPASQASLPHFMHSLVTRIGDNPSPGPPSPRGMVSAQLSVPSITLSGATMQNLKVACEFRAYFDADPGSVPFPQFIHGILEAAYSITTTSWQGQTILKATLTNDDNKIVFKQAPGGGLASAEVDLVAQQLRQFLRTNFALVSHPVPKGFQSTLFKGLGDPQGNQALAVPLNLSGAVPPPGALNGVTQVFTDGNDFAVAISKEYVESLLQPMLDQIRNFSLQLGFLWATYTVSITSVAITWMPGQIVLTVTGQATTGAWFFKNYSFKVMQGIQLKLNPTTQVFSLEPIGDPAITDSDLPAFAENIVKAQVIQIRANALAGAQAKLQQPLTTQQVNLHDLLQSLDAAGNLAYTAVALDPDGVLVKGDVQLSARFDPHVAFRQTPDCKGYTAVESWIPGGTIDRYFWTYYYEDYFARTWRGVATLTHADADRFVFLLPPPPESGLPFYPDGIFLLIWGTVVDPDTGDSKFIEAGEYYSWSPPLPPIPLQKPPLTNAIWVAKNLPDPPREGSVFPDAGIQAHINVAIGGDPWQHEQMNAIVQIVATEEDAASLGLLAEGVRGAVPPAMGVSVVVVFRQGLLTRIGPSIIPGMQKLSADLGTIPLMVTEDYQASWSRALGVPEGGATFLINSEGKLTWEHRGSLDAGQLGEALPSHLTMSGPSGRLLGLSMRVGDIAPDFLFELSQGEWLALRKLQGRRVLLNFWQSWSAPCLAELRRLQGEYDRSARDPVVILAVQGDDDPRGGARVRDQLGLKFHVLPDRNGAIAQQYGVRCWPTTILINQKGYVSQIAMGVRHGKQSASKPS